LKYIYHEATATYCRTVESRKMPTVNHGYDILQVSGESLNETKTVQKHKNRTLNRQSKNNIG
jgi:hypothetical protein